MRDIGGGLKVEDDFACGICGGADVHYYHGLLGYEAIRCRCGAESPLNNNDDCTWFPPNE